jgi:hypothetical protein
MRKEIAIVVAAAILLSVLMVLPVMSGEVENESILEEAKVNVAEIERYRTSEDQIIAVNCTSSSADAVETTATSDNIKLYLTGNLSEDIGRITEGWCILYPETLPFGKSRTWGYYYLNGDIRGTSYSYRLDLMSGHPNHPELISELSTTFKIEIIINGITVATFPLITVQYDPEYQPQTFSGTVTGLDPTTSSGDEVVFKITRISGDIGTIYFGSSHGSYITIPPLAPQSIQLIEGDVTMDEHVTMADAMFIAQYKAGLRSLNASQLECADTTDDGDVTMADAMHIAQWKADPDGTLGVLFKPLRESPADDGMSEPVDS